MDPNEIVQAYTAGLDEVIQIATEMKQVGLVRDQTKPAKALLAKLNNKVCASGTYMAGFNKAVRGID